MKSIHKDFLGVLALPLGGGALLGVDVEVADGGADGVFAPPPGFYLGTHPQAGISTVGLLNDIQLA